MFSILIPSYNYYISELVLELHSQAEKLSCNYEIIIIDDNSKLEFKIKNSELKSLTNVNYIELERNIGRAAIRNLLISKAEYEYILCLDCDAKCTNKKFLQTYIQNISKEAIVLCGGILYPPKPAQKNKLLRWKYGVKREEKEALERNKNEYKSFTAFNLFASKSIFTNLTFNQNIKTYGHEDTLLGYELEKNNIHITHINNPLIHNGIVDNRRFLKNTNESVKNLHSLFNEHKNLTDLFTKNNKLIQTYFRLQSFKISIIPNFAFDFCKFLLKFGIIYWPYSIFCLDLYKLLLFIQLQKEKS